MAVISAILHRKILLRLRGIEGSGIQDGECMIRGAIFDVDGTLLDSMGIWEVAGVRYQNIQVEPEPGLSKILYPMTIEEGVAYTKEHYNLPQSAEEITQGASDGSQRLLLQRGTGKKM